MATLTFPSLTPSRAIWELVPNPQRSLTSPLNNAAQTLALPGDQWMATLTFPPMKEDDARTMLAFLAQLRGLAGRFYLHDHSLPAPRGIATGTPLVNGASQTGLSLVTDGWTVSQAGILKAGDYIGYGTELQMVAEDVNSDGGGNATIPLVKAIRTSPSNNEAVVTAAPPAVMMLLEGSHAKWKVSPAGIYESITFSCIEALA